MLKQTKSIILATLCAISCGCCMMEQNLPSVDDPGEIQQYFCADGAVRKPRSLDRAARRELAAILGRYDLRFERRHDSRSAMCFSGFLATINIRIDGQAYLLGMLLRQPNRWPRVHPSALTEVEGKYLELQKLGASGKITGSRHFYQPELYDELFEFFLRHSDKIDEKDIPSEPPYYE